MIPYEELSLSAEIREKLRNFKDQLIEFRNEGPLDQVSLAKLDEHFKASHIYHSAGIEGNRLTLQETVLVIKEGIDISGKPAGDALEVRNLNNAFEYLETLSKQGQPVREVDIRSLHEMVVGDNPSVAPGKYRSVGVIISGAEHRPPEPLEVPIRMPQLIDWISTYIDQDPVVVSSLAHHELTNIHPFSDGNGRVSRLLMNLILMKQGYPICNIQRDDRPEYYEALSFADIGLFEPLIEMVLKRSQGLYNEYIRIRNESKRMAEWAQKWGTQASSVIIRRESRELELWKSRIRQIFLEFQKATELLDDELENTFKLSFYDYATEISLDKYQELEETGRTTNGNAFSIRFIEEKTDRKERFMFRYYRNYEKFPRQSKIIPLELNYFDQKAGQYIRISDMEWAACFRIRELFFSQEGEFFIKYWDRDKKIEIDKKGLTISDTVQIFFDDVLRNIYGYSEST